MAPYQWQGVVGTHSWFLICSQQVVLYLAIPLPLEVFFFQAEIVPHFVQQGDTNFFHHFLWRTTPPFNGALE